MRKHIYSVTTEEGPELIYPACEEIDVRCWYDGAEIKNNAGWIIITSNSFYRLTGTKEDMLVLKLRFPSLHIRYSTKDKLEKE